MMGADLTVLRESGLCACGCGQKIDRKRINQIYKDSQHRNRHKNRRWPVRRQKPGLESSTDASKTRSEAIPAGVTPHGRPEGRPANTRKVIGRIPETPVLWEKDGVFSRTEIAGGRAVLKVQDKGLLAASYFRLVKKSRSRKSEVRSEKQG